MKAHEENQREEAAMAKDRIVLGFAPTRRSIFSAPAAVKYADLTRKKLDELGIEYVDINDIAEDGLLHDEADEIRIEKKFQEAGVDGLFFPHTNFGCEFEVARLARKMNLPVLLWGPRDERPDASGVRPRDTQCGLFATGKVLRRNKVPFTYLTNCNLEDPEFAEGINRFIRICNVVKAFRHTRILQMGPRPYEFFSTMCNEGELLEKFSIQITPVPLSEVTRTMEEVKQDATKVQETIDYCRAHFNIKISEEQLYNVAALKVAIRTLAEKYNCNAGAIQCWNELQQMIGIMPCATNALLNEEGFPVVCETDIHGAVTVRMIEAATLGEKRSIFADWTIRHPDNDNGELLQHCGPWPSSCLSRKPDIAYPLAFDHPGAVEAEAKHENLTLARFDGDNGEYSLLLGNARGIDGPFTKGTYLWVEVNNWPRLEAKIVEGPYIHHVAGIFEGVVPVLYEACKYIGIKPDLYDDIERQVQDEIHGICR